MVFYAPLEFADKHSKLNLSNMLNQNVTYTNSLSRWKMSTSLIVIYAEVLIQTAKAMTAK